MNEKKGRGTGIGTLIPTWPTSISCLNFLADLPDAVNIDYDVDPEKIVKEIKIPIQGGLDPKILLTDKEILKKEVEKYLHIFKDHPYIFNLGHGILPETKIEMVENLIKIVRDFKWDQITQKLIMVKQVF